MDFSLLDHSTPLSEEKLWSLSASRVILADYKQLLEDYTHLEGWNVHDVDRWLMLQSAFISPTQVSEQPEDWVPDHPLPCFVNPYHNVIPWQLKTDSRTQQFMRVVAPPPSEDETAQLGWMEIKGLGVLRNATMDELRQEVILLSDAAQEFVMSLILDSLLQQYYEDLKETEKSPRLSVAGTYAIISSRCLVDIDRLHGNQENPIRTEKKRIRKADNFYEKLLPTAVLLRQPVPLAPSDDTKNLTLAIRHILNQFGLSLKGDLPLYGDGYILGDLSSLSFRPDSEPNAFSECAKSASYESCLKAFHLPPKLVRPYTLPKAVSELLTEEFMSLQLKELSKNISASWIREQSSQTGLAQLAEMENPENKDREINAYLLLADMKKTPIFAGTSDDDIALRGLFAKFATECLRIVALAGLPEQAAETILESEQVNQQEILAT